MRTDQSPTISRHDYQPYPYSLPSVSLHMELDVSLTRVKADMEFERLADAPVHMIRNGQELSLESVSINGRNLAEHEYALDDETLTIHPQDSHFPLEIIST